MCLHRNGSLSQLYCEINQLIKRHTFDCEVAPQQLHFFSKLLVLLLLIPYVLSKHLHLLQLHSALLAEETHIGQKKTCKFYWKVAVAQEVKVNKRGGSRTSGIDLQSPYVHEHRLYFFRHAKYCNMRLQHSVFSSSKSYESCLLAI